MVHMHTRTCTYAHAREDGVLLPALIRGPLLAALCMLHWPQTAVAADLKSSGSSLLATDAG